MSRLHVHLKVRDLDESARFYSALFGRGPDKLKPDYAKWMLDDPCANVSISVRTGETGVDHVGVEVESDDELAAIAGRVKASGAQIAEEADAACCYARSNKYWARSPEGAAWELFHSFGESAAFGKSDEATRTDIEAGAEAACCGPESAGTV